jgi:hypothetical protein
MQETQAGFHVKCQVLFSDFKQTWNVPTGFDGTFLYKIS